MCAFACMGVFNRVCGCVCVCARVFWCVCMFVHVCACVSIEYASKNRKDNPKIGKLEQCKDFPGPGKWIIVCEACPDNVEFVGKQYVDPTAFPLDSKNLQIRQLSDIVDAKERTAARQKTRSIYYRAPGLRHNDVSKLPSLNSLMQIVGIKKEANQKNKDPEVKKPSTDDNSEHGQSLTTKNTQVREKEADNSGDDDMSFLS